MKHRRQIPVANQLKVLESRVLAQPSNQYVQEYVNHVPNAVKQNR
jgi:hypothetical protein